MDKGVQYIVTKYYVLYDIEYDLIKHQRTDNLKYTNRIREIICIQVSTKPSNSFDKYDQAIKIIY